MSLVLGTYFNFFYEFNENGSWTDDVRQNKMQKGDSTYLVIGPISPLTDFNKNILKYIF